MMDIEEVISVVKIQETLFFIKERLFKPNVVPIVTINQENSYYLEEDLFSLTVICYFRFEDSEETFIEIRVQNVFRITGLKTFFDSENKKVMIPNFILLTVLGIATAHTRAILSTHIKGTHFQDLFIPVYNLQRVALEIFPDLYQAEQNVENVGVGAQAVNNEMADEPK